jgi:hypothetical protein
MTAEKFSPQQIEAKWQQRWEADGLYRASIDKTKPKVYFLTMLPYPCAKDKRTAKRGGWRQGQTNCEKGRLRK